MKKNVVFLAVFIAQGFASLEAADQYFAGDGSAITDAKYGATSAGPFTSSFTSGNTWLYAGVADGTGTGGTISSAGLTASQNFLLSSAAGVWTLSGTANVAAGKVLDLGGQVVAGTGFTKNGAGLMVLGGSSTFSGTTFVQSGTLRATTATAFGTSVVAFSGTSAVSLSNDTATNFGRTLIFDAASSAANNVLVSDRATAGAGVSHTLAALTIGSKTLTVAAGSNVTSGTAGIIISGNTALSGLTPIFDVRTGASLTLNTVSSGNGSTQRNINSVGGGNIFVTGVIGTGSGAVVQSGTGRITLSAANTYTGTTSVSNGTLRATTSASALGAGSLALSGGTLELGNNTGLNFGRNTIVSGSAVTIASDRLAEGAGVTHSLGTLNIGAQTLNIVAGANVTSGTAGLTFGAATLSGNATFAPDANTLLTLASVTGAGRNFAVNGAGDVTIAGAVTTTTGSVTKAGVGRLTMSGNNTYSGGTVINAGSVLLSGATGAGSGAVTLAGGTLEVNIGSGSGAIANTVTFMGGATYNLARAVGTNFSDYAASSQLSGGINTAATFLAGTASTAETMQTAFSVGAPEAGLLSDVFSLQGTNSDTFVMQLTVTGLTGTARLGWLDGAIWVEAVNGNTGSGALAGFYAMSFADFVTNNGGVFNAATMLGASGNDGAGNAWAVLNHNSDFAVIPEPQTWVLIGLAGTILLWRARRRVIAPR